MTVEASTGSSPADGRAHRVLVVDDEAPLAQVVASYLQREAFEVVVARDGPSAVAVVRDWAPDVVVLDLGLPGMDGLEVCRQVRTFSDCYVLMLTARGDEVDKLVGLSMGADDYMTKPFSPRELVARVRALLRRPRAATAAQAEARDRMPPSASHGPVLTVNRLQIDTDAHEVSLDDRPVAVTPTEFAILTALATNPGKALTRRALINLVWGADFYGDEHLVDVHIGHLRRKLGDDAADPAFVRTVRGVGYRLGEGR